ncbi:MAG TPA: alkaline phosphatase [Candidatus Limnocylindrales bacterium]|nr:alkaline phosphatase [Candidatus Limnocylindrales bacterium]
MSDRTKDAPEATPGATPRTATGGLTGTAFSRRALLKGTGAAATAVALSSTVGPLLGSAAAASSSGNSTGAATAAAGATRPKGPLTDADPHALTMRSRGGDVTAELAALVAGPRLRVLPIDNAKFLVGARFDLRVEATGIDPAIAEIRIKVRGPHGPAAILVGTPTWTSSAPDSVEVTYRGLRYPGAGKYRVEATVDSGAGKSSLVVSHRVVVTEAPRRRAKNVIFFLGDGMGTPVVTAARILSRGITQGKYDSLLNIDRMDYRGFVGTSGVDSIATDSANSMSAYMTGHKSSVNAMGVYEANEPNPNIHPRVETMTEILKRSRGMAVGIVTTSEIQDATPAAVWAHTRRRSEYIEIMDQALKPEQQADVILGGGRASLLPKSVAGSRRTDERDLRAEFRAQGFTYVDNRAELTAAVSGRRPPRKLIGTFHNGNLNVYLDREHRGLYPEQPTLPEMTRAALRVLARREEGFFLMVEAASIDKMEHPLDGPRAVYDTIEFDQAIGLAKAWAEEQGDTLVVVTADHNHSMSIVGTQNRLGTAAADRDSNGVYGDAGFPTYVDADGDGFPDDPNPDVQLFFGWSNHPDHSDDFAHNTDFAQPALLQGGIAVDNPARDPGALVQVGNLPYSQTNCVHTVEDVAVYASGPGAARFNAFQDNTELFFGVADALGLRVPVDRVSGGRSSDVVPATASASASAATTAARVLASVG